MSSSASTPLYSQEDYFSSYPMMLESLESRIAPATINAGFPDGGGEVNYTTPAGTPFVLADSAEAQPAIAQLFATSANHYYLELSAKDVLNVFKTGAEFTTLITVNAGKAIAFFYDANLNGIVEVNELTGLSLSGGADVSVGDSVRGDILVNLDAKTGAFSADMLSADVKGIKNLFVSGSVDGSILSGGSISKVTIGQNVEIIGTGSAANGYEYSLGGIAGPGGPGNGVLGIQTPGAKKAGANISNVTAGGVDSIIASDGGSGAAGGSITNVTLIHDTSGFSIEAGNGGDGTAGAVKGGAGGKVSNVVVEGVEGDLIEDEIRINGGNGGMGSGVGVGGAGGGVDKIYVGYAHAGSGLQKSPGLLSDYVYVNGGTGGAGKTGGVGGSLNDINIRVQPSDTVPLGEEIGIHAGDGGATTDAKGKSGNGGSVNNYFVINNYDGTDDPLPGVAVIGGDAGDASTGSKSGNGGSVTNGVILAKALEITAGSGASGATLGGNGGAITNLEIAYPNDPKLAQFGQPESNIANIFAQQVTLAGGNGGAGLTSGKGGNGGKISAITAPDTDLSLLSIKAGNGGSSTGGTGGIGGSLDNLHFESDRDSGNEVNAQIDAGDGGSGTKKGGVGGSISGAVLQLTDASITATTGNGGSSDSGTGANGGSASSVSFVTSGVVGGNVGVVSLTAGNGGAAGGTAKAGNGGALNSITAIAWGNVTVASGKGGAALNGTSGNGGTITSATLIADNPNYSFTTVYERTYNPDDPIDPYGPYVIVQTPSAPTTGSASLTAGDAGGVLMGGTLKKGGNGGSVLSSSVSGLINVSILAGKGEGGGFGGDIKSSAAIGSGFDVVEVRQTRNTQTGLLMPSDTRTVSVTHYDVFGDVTVTAGAGSNGAKTGGKGGSLQNVTAYTSFFGGETVFTAGLGGDGGGKAGAGGSINTLFVLGGEDPFSVIAGHGGSSAGKGVGGTGGSVNGVFAQFNDANLMIHQVAAGDGGDSGTGKGGLGGSVTNVSTFGDIGFRYGVVFGFDTMGGIFAGAGGTGSTNGAAGNVINVTASAISSIVAGRDADDIQLVSKVDQLSLAGNVQLISRNDGSFDFSTDVVNHKSTNLNIANYVGGISGNPTLANADQFKTSAGVFTAPVTPWVPGTIPLDGLIAALVMTDKVNTPANAWLQQNADGTGLQLVSAFNS